MAKLSKTQVDKLGDRLKAGPVEESDFAILDEYRKSFGDAYESVVQAIQNKLGLEIPPGRSAKTTPSIIDKLRRESIRLSQIQDVAGCRIIVTDVIEQDRIVSALQKIFSQASITDRRSKPSHGYRAVHLIVTSHDRCVEIQIRTLLQHLWAQVSESLSDTFDPNIKYGGGGSTVQEYLTKWSSTVGRLEQQETQFPAFAVSHEIMKKYLDMHNRVKAQLRQQLTIELDEVKQILEKQRRESI
ncbi:MAG: hypothetical protein ACKVT0_02880 [Planctomycetaceae bacterium]